MAFLPPASLSAEAFEGSQEGAEDAAPTPSLEPLPPSLSAVEGPASDGPSSLEDQWKTAVELDSVNSNPVVLSVLNTIDIMYTKFAADWNVVRLGA